MKLVSSNDDSFVIDTVSEALEVYKKTSDTSAALDILTKLKGIGPATASLLLAVHDPDSVVFFADEAFYWLCCNGKKDTIKYNAKEYKELNQKAQALARRLDVKAMDVERVAYVIMNNQDDKPTPQTKPPPKLEKKVTGETKPAPAKRKQNNDVGGETTLRRSKRGKVI